jgi:hypothetical protein
MAFAKISSKSSRLAIDAWIRIKQRHNSCPVVNRPGLFHATG